MAQVPIYEQQVGIETGGTPTPQLSPMTEAASGVNVFDAAAGIGKTVEAHAGQLAKSLIYVQRLNDQVDAQDKASVGVEKLQQLHAQLRALQGKQAMGIVHGADPEKLDPNSWMAQSQKIKDETIKGQPLYKAKLINRIMDSHINVMTGSLFEHEAKQTAVARDDSDNAAHAALVNSGTVAAKPKDLIELMDQGVEKTRNLAVRHGRDISDANIDTELRQSSNDEFAKAYVHANLEGDPQKTQNMLSAIGDRISPAAKATLQKDIDGKMLDVRIDGLTNAVITNPDLRAPDGQINEMKAMDFIHSAIAAQERSGTPLPPGHGDSIVSKLQSQIAIQNKAVTQKQQLILAKASNDIWSAQQSGMAPNEAYEKFIKHGQFDNALERGKAEEAFTKVYEKDPSALDTVWSHMSEVQKNTISQITNSKDFRDKFPYANDQKEFSDTLRQKIIETRAQNPDAINRLYQEQLKTVPTGSPRFLWFGKQQLPQYQIDESLQKNQSVVKAVGGLSAATALAQSLGGPDKLAPDTNESKAILVLAKHNYPINKETISAFITKRPDLLK